MGLRLLLAYADKEAVAINGKTALSYAQKNSWHSALTLYLGKNSFFSHRHYSYDLTEENDQVKLGYDSWTSTGYPGRYYTVLRNKTLTMRMDTHLVVK